MVFSAYSRLILLSDGIWDKTANELQREAFRLRMIGTDGTGDACSDSGLSNCSNYSIKEKLCVATCFYNENTDHICLAHQSIYMFEAECGAHTSPPRR